MYQTIGPVESSWAVKRGKKYRHLFNVPAVTLWALFLYNNLFQQSQFYPFNRKSIVISLFKSTEYNALNLTIK